MQWSGFERMGKNEFVAEQIRPFTGSVFLSGLMRD